MLGKRIQELRMRKGLSMSELAERSGVTKSYLNSLERGIRTNPSIQILEKIAGVLQIELESLIRHVHSSQPASAPLDPEWLQLIREMSDSGVGVEMLKSLKEAWVQNEAENPRGVLHKEFNGEVVDNAKKPENIEGGDRK